MICEYPHDSGMFGVLVVLGGCFCYFWAMQTDVHLDIFSDILHRYRSASSPAKQVMFGRCPLEVDSRPLIAHRRRRPGWNSHRTVDESIIDEGQIARGNIVIYIYIYTVIFMYVPLFAPYVQSCPCFQ